MSALRPSKTTPWEDSVCASCISHRRPGVKPLPRVIWARFCHLCGGLFLICKSCDRGHAYCSPEHSRMGGRLKHRKAQKRYKESLGPEGKLDHRGEQKDHRERRAGRVSDPSSKTRAGPLPSSLDEPFIPGSGSKIPRTGVCRICGCKGIVRIKDETP